MRVVRSAGLSYPPNDVVNRCFPDSSLGISWSCDMGTTILINGVSNNQFATPKLAVSFFSLVPSVQDSDSRLHPPPFLPRPFLAQNRGRLWNSHCIAVGRSAPVKCPRLRLGQARSTAPSFALPPCAPR